jgi:hypothetical protein
MGVDRKHYHIHIIVDSFYAGALDRVDHIEYILHKAYLEPVRHVSNRRERFLLKEMANGEFVLLEKAYLKKTRVNRFCSNDTLPYLLGMRTKASNRIRELLCSGY